MTLEHEMEVTAGTRFEFGENWDRFLNELSEDRIRMAERSLLEMLKVETLQGRSFLDIGSGSGLFSLAARRLGASVCSFDYDPKSVACTEELRRGAYPGDARWQIHQGSVLDKDFLQGLGVFDVVYSWGVLHHTGGMWEALANAATRVAPGGALFVALYNDQGRASAIWLSIKRLYNRLPSRLRWMVLIPALARLWGPTVARDLLRGRPLATWRAYAQSSLRGMSPWRDVVDWVGGLPFEVAKPEEVFRFFRDRGFVLSEMRTCAGGHGCNEFVFVLADRQAVKVPSPCSTRHVVAARGD